MKLRIRNQKDVAAGALYVLFGAAFSLGALNYRVGDAARMGPGWFPFAVGVLLVLVGLVTAVSGMRPSATPETVQRILGHFDYGDSRAFRLVGMLQNLVGMRGKGYEARKRQEQRIRSLRALSDPIDETLFRLLPPLRRLAQLVVLRFGKNPRPA